MKNWFNLFQKCFIKFVWFLLIFHFFTSQHIMFLTLKPIQSNSHNIKHPRILFQYLVKKYFFDSFIYMSYDFFLNDICLILHDNFTYYIHSNNYLLNCCNGWLLISSYEDLDLIPLNNLKKMENELLHNISSFYLDLLSSNL